MRVSSVSLSLVNANTPSDNDFEYRMAIKQAPQTPFVHRFGQSQDAYESRAAQVIVVLAACDKKQGLKPLSHSSLSEIDGQQITLGALASFEQFLGQYAFVFYDRLHEFNSFYLFSLVKGVCVVRGSLKNVVRDGVSHDQARDDGYIWGSIKDQLMTLLNVRCKEHKIPVCSYCPGMVLGLCLLFDQEDIEQARKRPLMSTVKPMPVSRGVESIFRSDLVHPDLLSAKGYPSLRQANRQLSRFAFPSGTDPGVRLQRSAALVPVTQDLSLLPPQPTANPPQPTAALRRTRLDHSRPGSRKPLGTTKDADAECLTCIHNKRRCTGTAFINNRCEKCTDNGEPGRRTRNCYWADPDNDIVTFDQAKAADPNRRNAPYNTRAEIAKRPLENTRGNKPPGHSGKGYPGYSKRKLEAPLSEEKRLPTKRRMDGRLLPAR